MQVRIGLVLLCGGLAVSALPLAAQSRGDAALRDAPYHIWPVEQLSKPGSLGDFGNYRASVQRRDSTSAPEVHSDFSHMLVFTSGAGNVVLGGQIVDGPGGKKIVRGGETMAIALGHLYHIPMNTVHWVVPDAGTAITYWVVNINSVTQKP